MLSFFSSTRATTRLMRLPQTNTLLLCILILSAVAFTKGAPEQVFLAENNPLEASQHEQHDEHLVTKEQGALPKFIDAFEVLQNDYFIVWQGIYPKAIDWTSAVIGTYVASALTTLSTSFPNLKSDKENENLINKYFAQLVGSYFGQDAFALRQEAYDDMLWVVLGWLESIKFIETHSALHYNTSTSEEGNWHGQQYIPAFAHRARIFWDLASAGWDTTLCDGGMIWSPYLTPYKNAITNELFIAASVSMYLYFPGDTNTSPFGFSSPNSEAQPGHPHDPKYLAAAIEAYKWLNVSNMTDSKGLYVDGYHISGWHRYSLANSTGMRCDERNEMVYTYNQGVLLTGQRGLYEATGARSYLSEGHTLVSSVIKATGWDLSRNIAQDEAGTNTGLGKWFGLGRNGVLEELCDGRGDCSQDAQTFKGIFFHHLTAFCTKMPPHLVFPEDLFVGKKAGFEDDRKWHNVECAKYSAWVEHNAAAAVETKDTDGKFGMWWNAPKDSNDSGKNQLDVGAVVELPKDAVDYRNKGIPTDWIENRSSEVEDENLHAPKNRIGAMDFNDRGRGRTAETQGGGVAVLRAAWEIGGKS